MLICKCISSIDMMLQLVFVSELTVAIGQNSIKYARHCTLRPMSCSLNKETQAKQELLGLDSIMIIWV